MDEIIKHAATILPIGCIIGLNSVESCQAELCGEEHALIQNATRNRVREFTAGRVLARRVLVELGKTPCSILRDRNGCPIWPNSVVGSITHKKYICAVLLGLRKYYISVGIDIELQEPLAKDIWSTFAVEEEIAQASSLGLTEEIFANILFSAKEAFYKCVYPVAGDETPPFSDLLVSARQRQNYLAVTTRFRQLCWKGAVFFDSSHVLSLAWREID